MAAFNTALIEHEIFDPRKETTKAAILKLWLVYCVSGIQICFSSIKQILQSELRVEGNKNSFNFYNKSNNAILSATPNLWNNIQIVRTYILKHNVLNPVSLMIRKLDFERFCIVVLDMYLTKSIIMFLTMLKM